VFLCLILSTTFAQESVMSANQNAEGTTGTVSYTVGQNFFRMSETAGGTITEGVQQPYEILFMTGIDDPKLLSLGFRVSPNPATTELKLKTDLEMNGLRFALKTLTGVVVRERNITSRETSITVADLQSGIYFLSLYRDELIMATWKVIKK
jgi:hypothetical protein